MGREAFRVGARSLFCYVAVSDLCISITELAPLLGMSPSAISYAVGRGKKIAEKKASQPLEKELLNN